MLKHICRPSKYQNIRIKTHIQNDKTYLAPSSACEGGVAALYRGCQSELVRGILFQSILMGCKESLQATNERLLLPPKQAQVQASTK